MNKTIVLVVRQAMIYSSSFFYVFLSSHSERSKRHVEWAFDTGKWTELDSVVEYRTYFINTSYFVLCFQFNLKYIDFPLFCDCFDKERPFNANKRCFLLRTKYFLARLSESRLHNMTSLMLNPICNVSGLSPTSFEWNITCED